MPTTFKNLIAGRWVAPGTRSYFENRNPANTRDLIGRFPDSGTEDVNAAVASAVQGFPEVVPGASAGPRRRAQAGRGSPDP
jgi:aldehyde dehydrogenase (NAD+)